MEDFTNPRPVQSKFKRVEKFQGIQKAEIVEYHAWCATEAIFSSESVPTTRIKGINYKPCITFERDTLKRIRYCPVCQSEAYPDDVDSTYCPRCLSLGHKNTTYARPGSSSQPTHPRCKLINSQVVAAARCICGYKDKLPRATSVRYLSEFEVINGKTVGKFITELVETADLLYLMTIPKEGEIARKVDWRRTAQAGAVMFTNTPEAEFRKVFTKYKTELVDSQKQMQIDSLKLTEQENRNYCDRFGIPDFSFLNKNQANQVLNENNYYQKREMQKERESVKPIQPDEPEIQWDTPDEVVPEENIPEETNNETKAPVKRSNVALMSVEDLKAECREYDISDEGLKPELVKRVSKQRKLQSQANVR